MAWGEGPTSGLVSEKGDMGPYFASGLGRSCTGKSRTLCSDRPAPYRVVDRALGFLRLYVMTQRSVLQKQHLPTPFWPRIERLREWWNYWWLPPARVVEETKTEQWKKHGLSFSGSSLLETPGRTVLHEGDLVELDPIENNALQRVHGYLFSDGFMLASWIPNRRGPVRYKFEAMYELGSLAVVNVRDMGSVKLAFKLLAFPDTRVFQCSSSQSKKEWLDKFDQAKKARLTQDQQKREVASALESSPKRPLGADSQDSPYNPFEDGPEVVPEPELPEWLLEVPEDLDVCIAQRHFEEAYNLLGKAGEFLDKNEGSGMQTPSSRISGWYVFSCSIGMLVDRRKVKARTKVLTEILMKELEVSPDKSLHGGLRAARRAVRLLNQLGRATQVGLCWTMIGSWTVRVRVYYCFAVIGRTFSKRMSGTCDSAAAIKLRTLNETDKKDLQVLLECRPSGTSRVAFWQGMKSGTASMIFRFGGTILMGICGRCLTYGGCWTCCDSDRGATGLAPEFVPDTRSAADTESQVSLADCPNMWVSFPERSVSSNPRMYSLWHEKRGGESKPQTDKPASRGGVPSVEALPLYTPVYIERVAVQVLSTRFLYVRVLMFCLWCWQACDLFLKLCSSILKMQLKRVKREGATVLYVRQLGGIFFSNLTDMAREFLRAFPSSPHCASAFVVWTGAELTLLASHLIKQVFVPQVSITTLAECVTSVRNQCDQLCELGLDLRYQLDGLLRTALARALRDSREKLVDAVKLRAAEDKWRPLNLQSKVGLARFLQEMSDIGIAGIHAHVTDLLASTCVLLIPLLNTITTHRIKYSYFNPHECRYYEPIHERYVPPKSYLAAEHVMIQSCVTQ
ncbi:hypothetical protein PR048_027172 [Dryococelus australis]|uniref:Exocyst complex component 8 n=1 Tax=Dryococelus australis TaxID=614101 RepID=A0ABQ9GGK7_9NEOP|nr:hypothetical protein PR048_027172 [Dryococelus australis]